MMEKDCVNVLLILVQELSNEYPLLCRESRRGKAGTVLSVECVFGDMKDGGGVCCGDRGGVELCNLDSYLGGGETVFSV